MKLFKKLTSLFLAITMCATLLSSTATVNAADSASISYGAFTEADFLKTNGKYIRNNAGNGNIVYLRGTNAGGWLVQESWMNPVNASCQQVIIDTLTNRFGEAVCNELLSVYEDNYWTKADFDNCAALGMSVIRLPFWYRNLVDSKNNLKADAFDRIDWFVEEAAERGIYVILDMHGAPGSQNGSDHSGVDGGDAKLAASKFFFGSESAANQELYYQLWETIAERYKGNPAVAGYDLLNEPYCTYRYNSGYSDDYLHTMLWNIYDKAYDKIRAIDPDHIIIMEATWNPVDLPNPTTYGWENVMYEYHNYNYGDYDNANGEQISSMYSKINSINSADYNVPSYMGEFCYFNNGSAWSTGLQLLNNSNLHWTSWSYKVVSAYGNWGIYNHNPAQVDIYNDSADTIRQKWSTVGNNYAWANGGTYDIFKQNLPGTISNTKSFKGQNFVGLISESNGRYACAENYGNDPVASNRDSVGGWEQFIMVNNSDGTISFISNANGKYLCAVIDGNGHLIARSNKIDAWEKFTINDLGNGKSAILSVANGKYVSVDSSDSILKATADSVTTAATFTIVQSGTISYSIEQPKRPDPIAVPSTFNATKYISKSSEIANNGNHVGNLIYGSYLDYLIDVPEAGDYTISIMAAAGDSSSDRTVSVYSGSTLLTKLPVYNSTDWLGFSELKNGLTLEKGVQTLRLSTDGSVNISDITIAKAPSTYQIPCNVTASKYMSAYGVVVIRNNTVTEFGYDDKTFYKVNVPETGEYKVKVTTSSTVDTMVHIDTDLTGGYTWVNTLNLLSTGSLDTYTETETTLNLTAGVQTLKFVSQDTFNFKSFSIEKVTTPEPEPEPDPEPTEEDVFVFKLANTTAYYYDIDTKYEIAVPAQFVSGRTLVPLREVSTSIGITDLKYEASTGKITFTSFDGYTVEMTMESTVATLTKDGTTVTETVTAPVFVGGVAMLPLRDAASFTGGTVKYDASGYVVVSAGDIADENIATYIAAYEAN